MRRRPLLLAPVLLASGLVAASLLTSACSSSASDTAAATASAAAAESAASAPASDASASEAPTSDAPASEAPASEPPASDAPAAPAGPAKPTIGDMTTAEFADAVLEQVRMDGADSLTDQLVTIAMSPLLRELASSADMTTQLKSKGDSVSLILSGRDATCVVRVTDQPATRGVTCR